MTKEQTRNVLIKDLAAVARKHNVVLDKYVMENGTTRYFFKLQLEDVAVDIEEVFPPVYHGPTTSNRKLT